MEEYIKSQYDKDTTVYVGYQNAECNGYDILYKIEYKAGDYGSMGKSFYWNFKDRKWDVLDDSDEEWDIRTDITHYDVLDEDSAMKLQEELIADSVAYEEQQKKGLSYEDYLPKDPEKRKHLKWTRKDWIKAERESYNPDDYKDSEYRPGSWTPRRWNQILGAVNAKKSADSINPPLNKEEMKEFLDAEKEKREWDEKMDKDFAEGKIPKVCYLVYELAELD